MERRVVELESVDIVADIIVVFGEDFTLTRDEFDSLVHETYGVRYVDHNGIYKHYIPWSNIRTITVDLDVYTAGEEDE